MPSKVCCTCKVEKDVSEYNKNKCMKDGLQKYCKSCRKVFTANYYALNKDAIIAREVDYQRRRYTNDTAYALRHCLSSRLNKALVNATKSNSTTKLLGMSMTDFIEWIRFQFPDDRFTFGNRGELWEIDHTLPFAAVDITKPTNQGYVCNAVNLRPMLKSENRAKRDKVDNWLSVCQEAKFRYFNERHLNNKYEIESAVLELK